MLINQDLRSGADLRFTKKIEIQKPGTIARHFSSLWCSVVAVCGIVEREVPNRENALMALEEKSEAEIYMM